MTLWSLLQFAPSSFDTILSSRLDWDVACVMGIWLASERILTYLFHV